MHCLLDQPIERRYFDKMSENLAPGAMYTVNQQCKFVFGSSAEMCPYMVQIQYNIKNFIHLS